MSNNKEKTNKPNFSKQDKIDLKSKEIAEITTENKIGSKKK